MSTLLRFLVFRVDQWRYALPLESVDRVIGAVEVTPLPNAPPIVLGVVNVHGHVLPVLNLRNRLLLPERAIRPADTFLLTRTSTGVAVLVVDDADGIVERPAADVVTIGDIASEHNCFRGVIGLDDGLLLIHDVDRFLSLDEARALSEAIREASRT